MVVTAIGLAHIAFSAYFDPINEKVFPEYPRRYTYVNGGIETALGLLLLSPRSRGVSRIVSIAYACHPLGNFVRVRLSSR